MNELQQAIKEALASMKLDDLKVSEELINSLNDKENKLVLKKGDKDGS